MPCLRNYLFDWDYRDNSDSERVEVKGKILCDNRDRGSGFDLLLDELYRVDLPYEVMVRSQLQPS